MIVIESIFCALLVLFGFMYCISFIDDRRPKFSNKIESEIDVKQIIDRMESGVLKPRKLWQNVLMSVESDGFIFSLCPLNSHWQGGPDGKNVNIQIGKENKFFYATDSEVKQLMKAWNDIQKREVELALEEVDMNRAAEAVKKLENK